MPSKEEYEKVFNQLLGTDIKWSKLTKEELSQLAVLFNNPHILLEKLGYSEKVKTEAIQRKIVDTAKEIINNYDGPIISLLRRLIIEKESKEKNERA